MPHLKTLLWGLYCAVLTLGVLGGIFLIIWSLFQPGVGDIFPLLVLPAILGMLLPGARKRFRAARKQIA